MGTANKCDMSQLQVGNTCIIVVDRTNSPTGIWWGQVLGVEDKGGSLSVQARITYGPFGLDDQRRPVLIQNSPQRDMEPVCYTVFPDNATTRNLFNQLNRANQAIQEARRRADEWRQYHFDTVAHLAGLGLIRGGPKEPQE